MPKTVIFNLFFIIILDMLIFAEKSGFSNVATFPQNSPLDCFFAFGEHAVNGWLLIQIPLNLIQSKNTIRRVFLWCFL